MGRKKTIILTVLAMALSFASWQVNLDIYILFVPGTVYFEVVAILGVFLAGLLLVTHLLFRNKRWLKAAMIVACMSLTANGVLLINWAAERQYKKEMAKIQEMERSGDIHGHFVKDVENGQLKYFTFGIGQNTTFAEHLSEKFDLEVYHMGCNAFGPLLYYNELVEAHLKFKPDSLSLSSNGFEFWP